MATRKIAKPAKTRKLEPDELSDAELKALCNFKAALTHDQMEKVEDAAQSFGVARRIALGVLTRNANDLSKVSIEDPDTYGYTLRQIESLRGHAKCLMEIAEKADIRLKIADCRAAATGAQA